MKASEARKLTEYNPTNDRQYAMVIGAIRVAATAGKSELWLYNQHVPSVPVREMLKKDGYVVHDPISERNETLMKIEW